MRRLSGERLTDRAASGIFAAMHAAVVTAAGSGSRFGGEKILADVRGRPLLQWTLARLRRVPGVGEVTLVLALGREKAIREEHGPRLTALGVTRIVTGGATRQESVRAGVHATPEESDLVLVHDAVRPCFSIPAAARVIEAAAATGAAILAVPARDTLKRVDGELAIEETVRREGIWHAETPQVVRRALYLEACRRAAEDGFTGTDEASLVERIGVRVRVVAGPPFNVKVTERRDLLVVDALLGAEEES